MKLKRITAVLAAVALGVSSLNLSSLMTNADEPFSAYVKYTVTEQELDAQSVSWQSASKADVYVHMTEGGKDSKINASVSLGENKKGHTSSKYLSGRNVSSGNAIQDELVGKAGTGNYVFPTVNLNKYVQGDSSTPLTGDDLNKITVTLRIDTPDTDFELLGIVFNNGAKYPPDFTVPTVEATTYDSNEPDPDPEPEMSARDKLKLTLDYCNSTDTLRYTEDSQQTLASAVAEAQAVYDNASANDTQLTDARTKLEKTKSQLLFNSDTSASSPQEWHDLSNDEIVKEMGAGINLGNTMDGHNGFTPGETIWQDTVTTKEYIKVLHDAGYNTIRIPVTWGNMIDTENGYVIRESWISRVQDIVDYCVEQDMYAIINIHHDGVAYMGGWLDTSADDIDAVYDEYEHVWRNIAEYFKDYDEHLIFEAFNEVSCMDDNESLKNSSDAVNYDTPILVNMNQIFVNVVRSTGSNNEHRWLAAVSHYANNGTSKLFSMPTDSYNDVNRLMFALHIYSDLDGTISRLQSCYNKFGADYPIYLGEYGTKSGTDNQVSRAYHHETVNRFCRNHNIVPIIWDQPPKKDNPYETNIFSYGLRATMEPLYPKVIEGIIRGALLDDDQAAVVNDPTVNAFTSITPYDSDTIYLDLGAWYQLNAQFAPADSNDVMLWSTYDDSIVTVYNGQLHAKGVGTAFVTVKAMSGSVEEQLRVVVVPDGDSDTVTMINVPDSIELKPGEHAYIGAGVEPSSANGKLSYKSSDTSVATVNDMGKVVGLKNGTAYVTVTSATGLTEVIKVIVSDEVVSSRIRLGMNVYYNDSAHGYYGVEVGEPVAVTGAGTYTLKFDLDKDLSEAGKKAGVTAVKNLTAIYIQDYDVTIGNETTSPVSAATIRYDKIVVDGKELTLTDTETFFDAMNGVKLDTGKPVNAWNGNIVEETVIDSYNHVASFAGDVADAKTVEITFTIGDIEFITEVGGNDEGNPATSVVYDGDETVVIPNPGETASVKVKIDPANTDSTVCFTVADSSVAALNSTVAKIDENGYAEIEIYAMGYGETTVTARTDNGLTVTFNVFVGQPEHSIVSLDKTVEYELKVGDTANITIQVTPSYDGSEVSYTPADDSVIKVESVKGFTSSGAAAGQAVKGVTDADGKAYAVVTALGAGKSELTVTNEWGDKVVYIFNVTEDTKPAEPVDSKPGDNTPDSIAPTGNGSKGDTSSNSSSSSSSNGGTTTTTATTTASDNSPATGKGAAAMAGAALAAGLIVTARKRKEH